MKLAICCSAHGFGHLTRQLAVAGHLRQMGVEPTLFAAAPPALIEDSLPGARVVPWAVDVGIAQQDSLDADPQRTLALLERRCSEAEVDRLSAALSGFDRVICDTAPSALEAARRAGADALAVGNFDWAWTYRHFPLLAGWAETFARWQAPHPALSLWPGPALTGFASVEAFGLVGRSGPPHRVAPRTCLVSFGGFGLQDLDRLLPRVEGLTWVMAPPMPPLARPDCRYVTGVPYPSLVAGADAVFTKPGYGILAEALLGGTRLVWVPRGAFPEAAFLARALLARGDVQVAASPRDLDRFPASLARALRRAEAGGRPAPHPAGEARRLAERYLA